MLSNIFGLQQTFSAVTIQYNSFAKSAKLRINYSREAASLKMVNFTKKEMKKIQSNSNKSNMNPFCSCQAVLVLLRMLSKFLSSVVDKLKLYQKQEYTTTTKQEGNYMPTYKLQEDAMVINSWQLYNMFSSRLFLGVELCRQHVPLSVFLVNFLAQYFTFNHHIRTSGSW